jgi:GxxExxY protein
MGQWIERDLPDDITTLLEEIRGIAVDVHREVGAGFRENVYQVCLAHALRQAGHKVIERESVTIRFRGIVIARAGEPDMIVDDKIVVELKAHPTTLHSSYRAQVVGYVKATGLDAGLLFNFHASVLLKNGTDTVVHPRYLQFVH